MRNGITVIGPSLQDTLAPPVSQPLILPISSVLLALDHKITPVSPAHCLKTIIMSDKHLFIPWNKAMMTPRLTFLLLCDENRYYTVKQIARLPYVHKHRERETDIAARRFF